MEYLTISHKILEYFTLVEQGMENGLGRRKGELLHSLALLPPFLEGHMRLFLSLSLSEFPVTRGGRREGLIPTL